MKFSFQKKLFLENVIFLLSFGFSEGFHKNTISLELPLLKRHSLKSGPESRDPGPWDWRLATLGYGNLELRPGDLGLATLRSRTLTTDPHQRLY